MILGATSDEIMPNVLLLRTVLLVPVADIPAVPGFTKLTRFSTLKVSHRISMDCLSVIGKRRERATSTSKKPGPNRLFTPSFPRVPGAGSENALALTQQLSAGVKNGETRLGVQYGFPVILGRWPAIPENAVSTPEVTVK